MSRVMTTLITLPMLCVTMGAAPFEAERWAAVAQADVAIGENGYVVQFPEALGGQRVEMTISSGRYKIEFDTANKASRLKMWEQQVSPIEILGMSTGPITITLEHGAPTAGTYDPDGGPDRAGAVDLEAVFRIEFDDSELRRIGLTSPFIMPAVETGVINADGVVSLTADGEGSLLGYPLVFSCVATSRLSRIEFLPATPEPSLLPESH